MAASGGDFPWGGDEKTLLFVANSFLAIARGNFGGG
jgi:hypothetical protein